MARGRRLYKYFTEQKWADAFLDSGAMRFRSLAYFRDYEDAEVRGDQNESIAILRPSGGLAGRNRTQGREFLIPNAGVEFCAKAGEIFVHCLSKSQSDEKRERFKAVACVEICDAKTFSARVQRALPLIASFAGPPGHERLGRHVQYYRVTDNPNPRWACPDLIALSKLDSYAWQDEFRLVFSLTDALRFENISARIVQGDPARTANPAEHHLYDVNIGSLRDIAVLHDVSARVSA
jgi:hypothetical protein